MSGFPVAVRNVVYLACEWLVFEDERIQIDLADSKIEGLSLRTYTIQISFPTRQHQQCASPSWCAFFCSSRDVGGSINVRSSQKYADTGEERFVELLHSEGVHAVDVSVYRALYARRISERFFVELCSCGVLAAVMFWRKGRLRISRSALVCLFGIVFGMTGTLMLSTVRRIPHTSNCDGVAKEPRLLLVGVMTAAKYVDTRAYNVWRTWGQHIPGKILFFVAEQTKTVHEGMPLVQLKGVNDIYPPQKKSFAMLKWMADNHLNDFDWFMRADDDLYVRGDKLERLLR
uniref:Hexosyltransferase n=1 Tax=Parascaris equorum TaxID=6256 RepID=A0A914RUA1_PAREQ